MYYTIRMILRYDMHTISYDLWLLTIHQYDTELFTHDVVYIVRYVSHIVQYWQPCLQECFCGIHWSASTWANWDFQSRKLFQYYYQIKEKGQLSIFGTPRTIIHTKSAHYVYDYRILQDKRGQLETKGL